MSAAAPGASVQLVTRPAELEEIAARCRDAERVAIDVEANGLFAYRPALCTVQLAWVEEEVQRIAVVDTRAISAAPLAPVLGPNGPVKVLHDLTFDAKLLDEASAPVARVRDTSVAARLLGFTSTGLASLLEALLGVRIDKRFQQHDWSERPLGAEHLAYLAADVRHLLALDERLAARAREADIEPEIEAECDHKLSVALRPPRDARPAYVRIKGAFALDAPGRAVLRRLTMAREAIAERADVPPFKVISNETLLEMARTRPAAHRALRAVRGAAVGRAGRHLDDWMRAIVDGVRDGEVPEQDLPLFEPPRVDRALVSRRRVRETQISAWRRAEAKRRKIDEQAVLPGHCAQDLLDVVLEHAADAAALRSAIAAIPGLGAKRRELYVDALVALAAAEPSAPGRAAEAAAPPGGETPA